MLQTVESLMGGGGGEGRRGVDSTPSLFPLFEDQLKQNLAACKYVTNSIQNNNKIDRVITGTL